MKKYLKGMVVFVLVFAFLSLAVGCGKQAGVSATSEKHNTSGATSKVETSTSEKEPANATSKVEASISKEEPTNATSKVEVSTSEKEPTNATSKVETSTSQKETENVKPETDDSYGLYRVSEQWVKEMSGMVVERDGKFYTLSGRVPQAALDDYGVGFANVRRGLEDVAHLFMYDQAKVTDVPTASTKALITAGDFPLIKINRNERVRLYSTRVEDHVGIVPTEQIGYTIEAIAHSDTKMYSPVLNSTMIGGQIRGTNPNVCDMTDTPVADVHDLVYGQSYKYTWYEGTEYHEMTLTADCKCYDWPTSNPLDSRVINLPVTLGKEGYSMVDFSGVEPGIYYTVLGVAVFEVE